MHVAQWVGLPARANFNSCMLNGRCNDMLCIYVRTATRASVHTYSQDTVVPVRVTLGMDYNTNTFYINQEDVAELLQAVVDAAKQLNIDYGLHITDNLRTKDARRRHIAVEIQQKHGE
eukprot:GHVU01123383.1.p2 GENE.GHVU01123383.1~~GHVU01123383.1.p2  ORF type:complete len:118 (+),score=9.97 GHVU01123383.1:2231-2584(+)